MAQDENLTNRCPLPIMTLTCNGGDDCPNRSISILQDLVCRGHTTWSRPIAELGAENFRDAGAGELAAWSRILDDEEALCVVNASGREERGARVLVDSDLNPPDGVMTVVLNTAQAAGVNGSHQVGETLRVKRTADGTAYVEIQHLPASEALVLMNCP